MALNRWFMSAAAIPRPSRCHADGVARSPLRAPTMPRRHHVTGNATAPLPEKRHEGVVLPWLRARPAPDCAGRRDGPATRPRLRRAGCLCGRQRIRQFVARSSARTDERGRPLREQWRRARKHAALPEGSENQSRIVLSPAPPRRANTGSGTAILFFRAVESGDQRGRIPTLAAH